MRQARAAITRLLPFVLWGVLVPAVATSQPRSQAAGPANVEVDPIRCWWRTSSGAVHVGETFSLVLTCAVLQNQAVQVIPDESRLDANVAQMAPFEVIGGAHPADLYRPNRRFFQYEYRLRVISPDVIGKDVKIPDPQIHYRINSTVAANTALQGRDHTYLLPPQSVRVLSLVPADAPDIRDSGKDGFAAAEQLGFRASVLQIAAVTAMVIGGLIALLGITRLFMRTRKDKPVETRGLAHATILRAAARELASVQQDASGHRWTDDHVARAMAVTRIAAAAGLGRLIHQQQHADVQEGDGRIVAGRWRRRSGISSSTTPEDLARALALPPAPGDAERRQLLEQLHSALVTFTTVLYARQATFDGPALDEALAHAAAATRRLRYDRFSPKSLLRRCFARPGRNAVMSGAKA